VPSLAFDMGAKSRKSSLHDTNVPSIAVCNTTNLTIFILFMSD
jgi:hypothetical protein